MIRFEGVNKRFFGKNGTVDALRDISLHVEQGDIYGIVGFSGAGKSTLLRMVNRLEKPDSGILKVFEQNLDELSKAQLRFVRRKIGMVFQQFNLLETKTVAQNIAIPLILEGMAKGKIQHKVDELLSFVELEDKKNTYVNQLSGGQKQRVGIARAIATEPSILLCDEATSALDPKTTASILLLLKKINREMGVTILLITHQMQVIQMICNKVAVMENAEIVEKGSVLEVFGKPKKPVTKEFVRTVVNDQIPPSIHKMLQDEKRHFRIERLKFIGEHVKQPVIAEICKTQGLEVNILGATVQEMQDSVMCLFLLQLIGQEKNIVQTEDFIDKIGILRERVKISC
ncbi:MAG: ATP-binding cassette domain-containing protein [Anaerotignum sp.]|nr:ATP-binding cassette domain-containing protein [Anaerotignum sp.]